MLVSYSLFGARLCVEICASRVSLWERILEDLGATDFAAVPAFDASRLLTVR